MKKALLQYAPILLFIGVCLFLPFLSEPVAVVKTYISGANVTSYIVYVLILITAVVFMPVTVMPLIPLATSTMGPFYTAILSVFGWTLGAMIAFLIARHFGRPFLERFVPMEKIDDIISYFPDHTRFLFIVLLRMTLPVDVISYALGLTKSLGFIEYSIATAVGVIWFSFAFAYLGEALISGNIALLATLGGVSLVIFLSGWYLLDHQSNKK